MKLFDKEKKSINNKFSAFLPQHNWKRRPSEIRGYHRALYMNTDNGDYLRVDYNIPEKKVRLYIEIENEGGNAYYSVIIDGRITSEKSVASGRYYGFSTKFKNCAKFFGTIPNKDILRIIGRNYDINKAIPNRKKRVERNKRIEHTKRKYFTSSRPKPNISYYNDYSSERNYLWDIFDILLGVGIASLVFLYFEYSFILLGVICAFYGIINGFIDMFIRERDPMFTKMIFFIFIGFFAYIYGYFF